jgi:hypothetical protein
MDTDTRITNYRNQRGGDRLTDAQGRRVKKKLNREFGGKTHPHIKDERCYTCHPAKRPAVALTPRRIRAVTH